MLGLIGGFYASYYRGISPTIFDFDTSILLFAMLVVGGMSSARGPIIGTAILFFISQHYLQSGPARFIAVGAIMLAITLLTTRGLVGAPEQVRTLLASRRVRRTGKGPPMPHPRVATAEDRILDTQATDTGEVRTP
jgi:branched-chain amino acid transport system permease protein